MSDSSNDQPIISEKVVKVMVDSILRKNGVKPEEIKKNIPEEQKQMIREMVEDLKAQVEEFNKKNQDKNND